MPAFAVYPVIYCRMLLRVRPLGAVLATIAMALAAAMITAVLILDASLRATAADTRRFFAGDASATIQPAGRGTLDDDQIRAAAGDPDVDRTASLSRADSSLRSTSVTLIGADADLAPFAPPAIRPLLQTLDHLAVGELIVGHALSTTFNLTEGAPLVLTTAGTQTSGAVAAVLPPSRPERQTGRVILTSLSEVRRLTGLGGVSVLLVHFRPGVDHTQAALRLQSRLGPGATVQTRADAAADALAGVAALRQAVPLLAGLLLAVGAVSVAATSSILARRQARDTGALRAGGATRSGVLGGHAAQGALLGLAGALAGVLPGIVLGRRLVATVPPALTATLSAPLVPHTQPHAVAIPVVVVTFAAIVAALAATYRTATSSVPSSTSPRARSTRLGPLTTTIGVSVGLLLLGAAVYWADRGPSWARGPSAGLLIAGWAGATAAAAPALAHAAAVLLRCSGLAGRLTASTLTTAPYRMWTSIVTVGAATATSIALLGSAANTAASAGPTLNSIGRAGLLIQADPPEVLPTNTILAPDTVHRLRGSSGVASLQPYRFTYIILAGRRTLLQGATADSATPMVANARLPQGLRPGQVIITTQIASRLHLRLGDALALAPGLTATVAAIVDSYLWPGGVIALNLDDTGLWFAPGTASGYEVQLVPGTNPRDAAAEISRRLISEPVRIFTGADALRAARATLRQTAATMQALGLLVLVVATLTTLTSLTAAALERRRDYALLRALGAPTSTISLHIHFHAGIIALLSIAIGTPLGVLIQKLAAELANSAQGLPTSFALVPSVIVTAAVAAAAACAAGALHPARTAAHPEVTCALRST